LFLNLISFKGSKMACAQPKSDPSFAASQ